MKYNGFITEESDPSSPFKAYYRAYYIPVSQVDGKWMPAGDPLPDPDDQVYLLSNVLDFQINRHGEPTGSLDDIPSPDGFMVVARYWLADDYSPPTKEQRDEAARKARQQMRDMGIGGNDA